MGIRTWNRNGDLELEEKLGLGIGREIGISNLKGRLGLGMRGELRS